MKPPHLIEAQKVVDGLVKELVPEEYRPQKYIPENIPPVVTNISIIEKESFLEMISNGGPLLNVDPERTFGLQINWGILRERARVPGFERWNKSHAVFLREDLIKIPGTMQLSFVILHEVGHVAWHLKRDGSLSMWEEEDEELYCDIFAYEQLKAVRGEDVAYLILQLCGSADGWNREGAP